MRKPYPNFATHIPDHDLRPDASNVQELIDSVMSEKSKLPEMDVDQEYLLKIRNEMKAKFEKRFPNGVIIDSADAFFLE